MNGGFEIAPAGIVAFVTEMHEFVAQTHRACCKKQICDRPLFIFIFIPKTEFCPKLWKTFHISGMLTQAPPFWWGLNLDILHFSMFTLF